MELFLFAQQNKLLKNCTQELAGKNVSKIVTAITLPMLQYPHRTLLMCRQMCFCFSLRSTQMMNKKHRLNLKGSKKGEEDM